MKKKMLIILLIELALGILVFFGYKTVASINEQNAEALAKKARDLEVNYERQNEAFYDMSLQGKYAPYRKEY